MARDAEFPERVRRAIAERAGYRCAVPYCNKTTIGPGDSPNTSASMGTACHIYSASDGGPRGTGGLTIEQRQSAENGIWCCADHGRLIDTNSGKRYPAELLIQWKKLHEARLDREASGFVTRLGWVHQLDIINSFLFQASSRLEFSKATLIQGDGAVGKSAICEWLSGLQDGRSLERWRKIDLDVRLDYFAPEATSLRLAIQKGEIHRYHGANRLVGPPHDLAIVWLAEDPFRRFYQGEADDLTWMATAFGSDPETIRHLCEDIRVAGHDFCRDMEWREVHEEEEDGYRRDGWYLYVSPEGGKKRHPFAGLATSESIAVLVQTAAALARVQSQHRPTLLILDAGGWNWGAGIYGYFAPFLAAEPYQVMLVGPSVNLNAQSAEWRGWAAVDIVGDEERTAHRRPSRIIARTPAQQDAWRTFDKMAADARRRLSEGQPPLEDKSSS